MTNESAGEVLGPYVRRLAAEVTQFNRRLLGQTVASLEGLTADEKLLAISCPFMNFRELPDDSGRRPVSILGSDAARLDSIVPFEKHPLSEGWSLGIDLFKVDLPHILPGDADVPGNQYLIYVSPDTPPTALNAAYLETSRPGVHGQRDLQDIAYVQANFPGKLHLLNDADCEAVLNLLDQSTGLIDRDEILEYAKTGY